MHLKCDCCGFEQDFTDGEAAFQAGWDAPPHFTGYVSCDICPAVCTPALKLATHVKAHAYWTEHGRPTEFNNLCVDDKHWGESQATLDQQIGAAKDYVKAIIDKMV